MREENHRLTKKVKELENEICEIEKARDRFRNLTLDQKQEIKKLRMKKPETEDNMDNEITFQIKKSVQSMRQQLPVVEKENYQSLNSNEGSKKSHQESIKADIKNLIADYKKDKK